MEFIEYPDSEMMMMNLANRIAGALKACMLTAGPHPREGAPRSFQNSLDRNGPSRIG